MIVRVLRGERVESEHAVSWCLVEGGRVAGPVAERPTFLRSVSKPLQALPAVEAGVLEHFGLGDRHLALACASHGGGPEHIELVQRVLWAARLSEEALGCGPLEPRDPRAAEAMAIEGVRPRRVHHNCSGKHALALALCVAQGWPVREYLDDGHPLRLAQRTAIADGCGLAPEDMVEAVDGCGMRTYVVPLKALAHAFAGLAGGTLGPAAQRAAHAMRAHPMLVAYPGAIDTELMTAEEGLVCKLGAEGVLGIGLPDGRGLALKVHDGALRALDPAAVWACRELLGLKVDSDALRALETPPILNSRGEVVGRMEVARAPPRRVVG